MGRISQSVGKKGSTSCHVSCVMCHVSCHVPGKYSGSRSHETLSVIASAAGNLVWPRLVLKGIRDVSKKHLSCLEPGISTGNFRFSYTESGFVNKDVFCQIILDLDEYLTVNKTPRPVLLLIDGATCHISLKARDLAKDKKIMLWLLYPNSTHVLQPLDLGLFAPVKNVF